MDELEGGGGEGRDVTKASIDEGRVADRTTNCPSSQEKWPQVFLSKRRVYIRVLRTEIHNQTDQQLSQQTLYQLFLRTIILAENKPLKLEVDELCEVVV